MSPTCGGQQPECLRQLTNTFNNMVSVGSNACEQPGFLPHPAQYDTELPLSSANASKQLCLAVKQHMLPCNAPTSIWTFPHQSCPQADSTLTSSSNFSSSSSSKASLAPLLGLSHCLWHHRGLHALALVARHHHPAVLCQPPAAADQQDPVACYQHACNSCACLLATCGKRLVRLHLTWKEPGCLTCASPVHLQIHRRKWLLPYVTYVLGMGSIGTALR